jgi:hypothetical protein
MNRTRWIALVVAVVTAGSLGLAGLALRGGDDAPTTPSATPPVASSTLQPPVANTASLEGSETITLFDKLTLPRPVTWESTQGGVGVAPFSDVVTCVNTAGCPQIIFFDLATSEGKEASGGDDPLKLWAETPCEGATLGAIEGPAQFTLDGHAGLFYQQQCGEVVKYLWSVPDKQLLVTAYPGLGGLSAEIIQGVLESGTWA